MNDHDKAKGLLRVRLCSEERIRNSGAAWKEYDDAVLSAERERVLGMTPEAVMREAYAAGDKAIGWNADVEFETYLDAALPLLVAPERARREQAEREVLAWSGRATTAEAERDRARKDLREVTDAGMEAIAKREQAERERDEMQEENASLTVEVARLEMVRHRRKPEVGRLRGALKKYGDHDGDCAWRFRTASPEAPVTAPPEERMTLDFEAAHKELWAPVVAKYGAEPDGVREYISPGLRRALNAQVAEIVRVAVERERERVVCEERQHTQTTIDRTRAEYAPLVALVREWVEARKGEGVKDMAETLRFAGACQALAAWGAE